VLMMLPLICGITASFTGRKTLSNQPPQPLTKSQHRPPPERLLRYSRENPYVANQRPNQRNQSGQRTEKFGTYQ
jgi:hypothetical protein